MGDALAIAVDLRTEYGKDALGKSKAMLEVVTRKEESKKTVLMWTKVVMILMEVA